MRPIQRIISVGFATAALASASLPALSWNAWAENDLWSANSTQQFPTTAVDVRLPDRDGTVWVPGHYQMHGTHQIWVQGHWKEVGSNDLASLSARSPVFATGPLELRDREGKVIPTSPDAYPLDSARR